MQDEGESLQSIQGLYTRLIFVGAHHLLAQIPLTVSPFISLPTATTLPYTYKPLPSTLPPSSTGEVNENQKLKYVVSQSGHTAHPDEIIASCQALQSHLQKMQEDAQVDLKRWHDQIKERELAEKRRVAPGWLDREEKILEPEKISSNTGSIGGIGGIGSIGGIGGTGGIGSTEGIGSTGTTGTTGAASRVTGSMKMDKVSVEPVPLSQTFEGEELDRAFGG